MKTALNVGAGVLIALVIVAGAGTLAHQQGLLTLHWLEGPAEQDEHAGRADEAPGKHAEDHPEREDDDADHDGHGHDAPGEHAEDPDDHEGHGHEAHEEEATHEEHDGHEGHGHDVVAEVDDHDGHDHEAHEEPEEHAEHDEHEGHDHAEHAEEDGHDGHDHDAHAGHEDEGAAKLTEAERARAGIVIEVAGRGAVGRTLSIPGEVAVDADRVVHIVPRAAGIVHEVTKSVGDRVEAGDVLAWIESGELAEAKLTFYDKLAEIGCCEIELPRAKEIFENTTRLLTLLSKDPSEEELRKLDGLEMGEYRGKLIAAHVAYKATKKNFEREKALHGKNISSGKEMIEAETAFEEAEAALIAARDTIRYQILVAYSEAVRKRQVAEFEVVAAEKRLRLKGADDKLVSQLRALVPKTESLTPCTCDDPNCKDGELPSVTDTLGKDRRFAWYALRAPQAGIITEKHITVGEKVNDETEAFTITDLSAVWVNLSVYPRDLAHVAKGRKVVLDAGAHGVPEVEAPIAYVSPTIGEETRTASARLVVPNPEGHWRPGLFVTARLAVGRQDARVAIPRDAVQTIDDESVVFVEEGDALAPRPVKLGQANGNRVEIVSGLRPGERYVAKGAFELKARIVTSGMDPHAGHGH